MAFIVDRKALVNTSFLPNTKVSAAKKHGKNYMKVIPLLFRHLLRNRLLKELRLIPILNEFHIMFVDIPGYQFIISKTVYRSC